jgi:tripartite-type tricarboxylate transporter receptor subunit TctC
MNRLIAWLFGMLLMVTASAQPFPTHPVKVIVPFPPGGGADVVLRVLAPAMSEALGQPIVIDNRAGAGGNIGTDLAAHAPADGYTVLVATAAQTVNNTLSKDITWNLTRDFAPVSLIVRNQIVLAAKPALSVATVQDLIKLARANPGRITYASYGTGSTAHMSAELFKMMAGVDLLHIPYRGAGPAINDLIAGQVDVIFADTSAILPFIRSGQAHAIAFGSTRRFSGLADVPTVAEAGVPGYETGGFLALLAPAGTPRPAIDALRAALLKAMDAPGIRERLEAQGGIPSPSTPEELAAFLRSDIDKWARVIKTANIHAD